MNDERKQFFEEKLRPLLDSEEILIQKSDDAIQEGLFDEAILFLRGVLLINSDNKEAKEKIKVIKQEKIKSVAYDFIKKFYPKELAIFELAWRVFKDITLIDFRQEVVSGALGIVGRDDVSDIVTPKLLIVLNEASELMEDSDSEQTEEDIYQICKKLGCSQDFSDNIIGLLFQK